MRKTIYHVSFLLSKDHAVRLRDIQCVMLTCINCSFSWSRLKAAIIKNEKLPEGFEPALISVQEVNSRDRIAIEQEVKEYFQFGNFYLFDGELAEVPEHKKPKK